MDLETRYRKARSLLAAASMGAFLAAAPVAIPSNALGDFFPALATDFSCTTPGTTPVGPGDATSSPASWPQARVAQAFARMSPDAAIRLATTDPARVGPLDGAPLALRYRANALLAGPAYAGRQLLLFDRGGTGRVVEVLGDLSSAHRIAVLVPGVDNRLADFDRGLGGVQRRAPAWQARHLRAAAGPDVAVVAWLGYLPPAGVDLEAVRSDRAQRGADDLVAFVRGLAVRAPQATVVIVGHSYGTLVTAHAGGRLPADVTDLVEIGSPGLDVEHCRDLQARARVWAGSSPSDWTRWLPDVRIFGLGHGPKPNESEFGARALDVADADGHDGYYVPGTAALRSIAHVVAGE